MLIFIITHPIFIVFLITIVAFIAIALILRQGMKGIITRLFGTNGWELSRRGFYVAATVFLVLSSAHRLYYYHDEVIYSGNRDLNLGYSNQIEVETYLMSQQNLIDLFDGKPPTPDKREVRLWSDLPESNRHEYPTPFCPRFYLVVRVKNHGNQIAWGVLDYCVDNKKTRQIDVLPLPANMPDFKNIVLITDFFDRNEPYLLKNQPSPYPEVKSTWTKLFTKKRGEQ